MPKRYRVCLTVDVEQDCPPFRDTYAGIERGLPRLLELLATHNVRGTFFTTGDVARRFPAAVAAMLSAGHELGCHGDTHRRFDEMSLEEARAELNNSTETLRRFTADVRSFRAPNLAFPPQYLPLLAEFDYRIDSSVGKHKIDYWRRSPHVENGPVSASTASLRRVPASTTSSVLRWPRIVRNPLFAKLVDPIVLFVHPWEFVDWRKSTLRWDCRFRTGEEALRCLAGTLDFFRRRGAEFQRLVDLEAA